MEVRTLWELLDEIQPPGPGSADSFCKYGVIVTRHDKRVRSVRFVSYYGNAFIATKKE